MANAYMDFKTDFSTYWFHLLKGRQRLFFVKPTEENLAVYKKLVNKPKREKFFPNEIKDETYEIDLKEGHTVLLPAGCISATFTYEQSLLFEGYLLNSFQADMQIRIYQMKEELRMGKEMVYPYFKLTHWLATPKVLSELKQLLSKENCERNPLDSARYKNYWSFVEYSLNYYDQLKKRNEATLGSTGDHFDGMHSKTEVEKNELNEWETILKHPNLESLREMKRMLDDIGYEPAPSLKRKSGVMRVKSKLPAPKSKLPAPKSPYMNDNRSLKSKSSAIDDKGIGVQEHPRVATFGEDWIDDEPMNIQPIPARISSYENDSRNLKSTPASQSTPKNLKSTARIIQPTVRYSPYKDDSRSLLRSESVTDGNGICSQKHPRISTFGEDWIDEPLSVASKPAKVSEKFASREQTTSEDTSALDSKYRIESIVAFLLKAAESPRSGNLE